MLDKIAADEISCALHTEQIGSPRDNSYVRISGISDCRRKIAYRLLAYKNAQTEQGLWSHALSIFDIGHGIHLRLQQRLSNPGPLKWVDADPVIDSEGRFGLKGNCEIQLVDHEYKLKGHCDALTNPLKRVSVEVGGRQVDLLEPTHEEDPDGIRYLIDIKSITARDRLVAKEDRTTGKTTYEVKTSAFEKLQAPKPEHIAQASLYAWLTTRPGFKTDRIAAPLVKIPQIMIIYVAKDLDPGYYDKFPDQFPTPRGLLNVPYKVFTQPVDLDHVKVLLAKIQGVWRQLESSSLPPRDYHHTPDRPAWACVDCPFRSTCYSKEGHFQEESLDIPPLLAYRMGKLAEK